MITPIYAALLALIFVFLSIRTIKIRRHEKIAVGSRDSKLLLRAMRVHANFAEYTPLALLLILMLELMAAHILLIHGLGFILLVGRCLHAYGVSKENEKFAFRVTGMALTFTTLLTSAFAILLLSILN
jgi:uncharacterized membrane protein YecN with MAPEG domain